MPQKKWTEEQEEFLKGYLPEFRTRTVSKKYKDFWSEVGIKFFERWPERNTTFGDLPESELTPEQSTALAKAIAERRKVSELPTNHEEYTLIEL